MCDCKGCERGHALRDALSKIEDEEAKATIVAAFEYYYEIADELDCVLVYLENLKMYPDIYAQVTTIRPLSKDENLLPERYV